MRGTIVALLVCAGIIAAEAQVRSVKLVLPDRLFGYFVGDVIHSEVDVTVGKGAALNPASVPAPGPLDNELELIDSRIEEGTRGGAKLYRLFFKYQNFYPALDSRALRVPAITLSFIAGGRTLSVQVPSWSFVISPLREVLPAARASGADYMQPDVRPPLIDPRYDRIATFGFFAAALFALAILAYHLALWPFGARPKRPFAAAARHVHGLLPDTGQDELGYRDALLTLHRAVDATAGHAVFAEDLPEFLDQAPVFSRLREEFALFFRSSRQAFFANNLAAARADLSPRELRRFADRLATAERAAR